MRMRLPLPSYKSSGAQSLDGQHFAGGQSASAPSLLLVGKKISSDSSSCSFLLCLFRSPMKNVTVESSLECFPSVFFSSQLVKQVRALQVCSSGLRAQVEWFRYEFTGVHVQDLNYTDHTRLDASRLKQRAVGWEKRHSRQEQPSREGAGAASSASKARTMKI